MKVLCFCYASDIQWQLNNQDSIINGQERLNLYNNFKDYGVEYGNFIVAPLSYNKSDVNYIKEKIRISDVIFFNGGKMENIRMILKSTMLWEEILKYKNEKIFIGSSAGAMILQDEYIVCPYVDDDYNYYGKEEGLGIISKYSVLPHFYLENENHIFNLQYSMKNCPTKCSIGLSEQGGIIIHNFKYENRYEVLGKIYTI